MHNIQSYIAVLDPGSSNLVLSLGYKEEDNKVNILASRSKAIDTEIRRGVVQNVPRLALLIEELMMDLLRDLKHICIIDRVYVGLNLYSTQCVDARENNNLNAQEPVSDELLSQMFDGALGNSLPEEKEMIAHFHQGYMLDNFLSFNPVGERPNVIEARYKLIAARKQYMRNLENSLNSAGLQDCRHILGVQASAEAVLTEEDKDKGAIVLDFGGGTTSMCIYEDNLIRYVCVLPFGGKNISRDLRQLQMSFAEAEELKQKRGRALHYTEQIKIQASKQEEGELGMYSEPSQDEKEINEIMVARSEEIVENIWAQIAYSGVNISKIGSGIVICGGASQMDGLDELLRIKTQMPVRRADLSLHLSAACPEKFKDPAYAHTIGLIMLGERGGCKLSEQAEQYRERPEQATLPMEDLEEITQKTSDKKLKKEQAKVEKKPKEKLMGKFGSIFDNIMQQGDF